MARCLTRQYKKIILYIYGICKSAGTLVSVAANEIILSDFGEFGPLDVQLGKPDELFEQVSGLNITQALNSLNTRAQNTFREVLIDLKRGSKGQLTTKLAAEIACRLAIGLYEKI
jgi:ClpP class serine protease